MATARLLYRFKKPLTEKLETGEETIRTARLRSVLRVREKVVIGPIRFFFFSFFFSGDARAQVSEVGTTFY